MEGKLLIFSAPSGSGKTTIVQNLLQKDLNLEFSISATSRPKRNNEIDTKDYYFLSPEEFKAKIQENAFLEWEEVYENRFYGTLKSEIDRIWKEGNHVIFDVDVVGGVNIKKAYQEKALSIFIMPPNVEELERRLRSRLTDSEEDIRVRVSKAAEELSYANQFDVVVVNDDLQEAIKQAEDTVRNFIQK